MTHSYKIHHFHLVWSTKNRNPWISKEIQERLYSYLGGIIVSYKGKLLEIGGMPDHVHLLIELSLLDNYSNLIRDLKSASSLWIHKEFPQLKNFAWQEGFGSFSLSYSSIPSVKKYIQNQETHHAEISFDDEYKRIISMHDVAYNENFVLG